MQAIIMAAGRGSRLGELTAGKPKSFIQINGKKLIDYNLKLLQIYGVKEIIIVTGYQCEAFEDLVKDWENVRLVYNPFYEMVNVLGSFYMGMNLLHDDFIYLHADTICEPRIIEKLVQTESDIALPIDYKLCDDEAMKIKSEGGKIVQITKQIPVEQAEGEFIGIAFFNKKVITSLQEQTKQLMIERQFTAYFESAVQRLIEEEHFDIQAVPVDGAFWAEIDFMEDYEKAVKEIPQSLTGIFT